MYVFFRKGIELFLCARALSCVYASKFCYDFQMERVTPNMFFISNKQYMNKKGFTLIELLIVITIIGILAVALLPRLLEGPKLARDTQRKATLNTLATKLQIYSNDNGVYPDDGVASGGECPTKADGTPNTPTAGIYGALTTGNYMTSVDFPRDPQPTNKTLCGAPARSYWYNSVSDNQVEAAGFILAADVEVDKQANSRASKMAGLVSIETYVDSMETDGKIPNPLTSTDVGPETVLTVSSR
jgi:prepilin-type N-terminal cleavage/methylation domain-containing protein